MESIYFTEKGRVKLSDMTHVFLGTFKPSRNGLYALAPDWEDDVWTLGVILLLCMSHGFDPESSDGEVKPVSFLAREP